MTLNNRVYKHFEEYVTDHVHPMTALRTSVSYVAHFDPEAENESDENKYDRAIRIQAKIASLVTAFARVRDGKEPVKLILNLVMQQILIYVKGENYQQKLKLKHLIRH